MGQAARLSRASAAPQLSNLHQPSAHGSAPVANWLCGHIVRSSHLTYDIRHRVFPAEALKSYCSRQSAVPQKCGPACVIDSSNPPNPVLGADILFLSYIGRLPQNQPIVWAGESSISRPTTPVIVSMSQSTFQSDVNGLASIPLSAAGISGNVTIAGLSNGWNQRGAV